MYAGRWRLWDSCWRDGLGVTDDRRDSLRGYESIRTKHKLRQYVVLVYLAGLLLLLLQGSVEGTAVLAFAGAGGRVALVGWIDDRQSLAARWRLAVHFLAAGWGLFWLGGLPPVVIYAVEFDLGWLGHGLALLYLVWLLNLYNFMDGIDGLAGVEAVTVAAGGTVLLALAGFGLDS